MECNTECKTNFKKKLGKPWQVYLLRNTRLKTLECSYFEKEVFYMYFC